MCRDLPEQLFMTWTECGIIAGTGAAVGFLSGLLGKGGSAITTPSLQIFAHVNPFSALASPLPATLPSTLVASYAYREQKLVNKRVVMYTVLLGIPPTVAGSFFSNSFKGNALMMMTAVFVLVLGLSFFIRPDLPPEPDELESQVPFWKLLLVSTSVGLLSGLLANSGGVLYGPLFIRVFRMPVKNALASSLVVSAILGIPGTITHWYLGHIDWLIVLILSCSAIPFSYLGARLALKMENERLERVFAFMLVLFGAFDLFYSIRH